LKKKNFLCSVEDFIIALGPIWKNFKAVSVLSEMAFFGGRPPFTGARKEIWVVYKFLEARKPGRGNF